MCVLDKEDSKNVCPVLRGQRFVSLPWMTMKVCVLDLGDSEGVCP